jgi:hypothetical protein
MRRVCPPGQIFLEHGLFDTLLTDLFKPKVDLKIV